MNFPNPTPGDTASLNWDNRMRAAARASRVLPGRGMNRKGGTGGTIVEPRGRSSGPITTWHFKSMEGEYLICRTWDGENEGSQDVRIAKPPELRFSVDTETIDGTVVNYSDYDVDAQTRLASDGSTDEAQVIVPRYLVDGVIFACRANSCAVDEDGKSIGLQDLNAAGRAWAAIPAE